MDANTFGILLAAIGSIISIYGTIINNLVFNHVRAMIIWAFSNTILMLWAFGQAFGFWNGGVSSVFLCSMYSVFTATNFYAMYVLYKSGSKLKGTIVANGPK